MLDQELLKYVEEKKKYIFLAAIFNICGLLINVGTTALIILLVQNVIDLKGLAIVYCSLGILASLILRVIFNNLVSLFSTKIANYAVYKLRNDTYLKYLELQGGMFSVNEMAQLSTEGIEQLRLYYSLYLPSFFYSMVAPILLFGIFLFLSYKVALVYLVCIPLIPMSIILVSKWAKRIFNKYWSIYLGLGDAFLDNVKGLKELLIFNYDEAKALDMQEKSEEFRKITMKVLTMQLASVTIMDLVAYGGAGVGIVLSLLEIQGGLSLYYGLFMILVGAEFFLPLRALGSAFHVAMNGVTSGKKVMNLLKETPHLGTKTIAKIENIEIKALSFGYYDNLVLDNVNLNFKVGLTSIVGISGSGKSTIAKLLLNREMASNGQILFNNDIDVKDIRVPSLYEHAAYISSNSYLLSLSIRDLFKFYNQNISEEEIWKLLKLVFLDEVISNNGGLDFKIKEGGINVSGGEKQRIMLALYLAKEYDFYIFDEATSNIDSYSEDIILNILKEISQTKIVLLITHRLRSVLKSDYIYYLADKKIKEEGTPQELLSQETNFNTLFKCQEAMEVV